MTLTEKNKLFLAFLKEWIVEIYKEDCGDDLVDFGLCWNFQRYLEDLGVHYRELESYTFLKEIYFSDKDYPFGDIGNCHKNPERVKWVKETINKLTKELES